ncbi:MAG: hypothetical protein ACI861_000635 [Paracoccaceae bacterium]|jgi:hypothetical protein
MSMRDSFKQRLFERPIEECEHYGSIAIACCQRLPFDLELALELKRRLGHFVENEKGCGFEVADIVQALASDWHKPELIETECLTILTSRPKGYLEPAIYFACSTIGVLSRNRNSESLFDIVKNYGLESVHWDARPDTADNPGYVIEAYAGCCIALGRESRLLKLDAKQNIAVLEQLNW